MTVTTPTDIINNNFKKAKVEIEALKNKNARNIGELVYSSIPLSDAGLHLLDGSLIQGTGIYAGFVTYIASLYNATGNPYANCFVTESRWQETLSNYGVCGKFVYNSTNSTVRLPKITGVVEGTITAAQVGSVVEASLPSTITSSNYLMVKSSDSTTIEDPDEVQPQTTKLLVYMVVANSTKTEIEVDIDNVATDLNNFIPNHTSDIMDCLISSSKKTGALTIGSTGTSYTAPADGYFQLEVHKKSDSGGWAKFMGNGITDGVNLFNFAQSMNASYIHMLARAGDKVWLYYSNIDIENNRSVLRFYYTENAKAKSTS